MQSIDWYQFIGNRFDMVDGQCNLLGSVKSSSTLRAGGPAGKYAHFCESSWLDCDKLLVERFARMIWLEWRYSFYCE
jgi:hypothetical protein